ncbi:MAG: L,D-transpeptidase family protein [Steroidobacteraceae bacterium]
MMRLFKTLLCGLICSAALHVGSAQAVAAESAELPMADRIVVRKAERKLFIYSRGRVVREYPVRLGLRPEGAKEFEGDFRTPEGHYQLARRNPQSDYFLSIQVNYPNDKDVARAKRQGQKPGDMIMIHGLPNTPRKPLDYYQRFDWTDGCIAVSNSDMVEIWLMTKAGTPIEYPAVNYAGD